MDSGSILDPHYEDESRVAVEAVRAAAQLCRRVREQLSPEVLSKKDKSPVTVADFGSQAVVCRALAEAFPDDPIIAEEDATELKSTENAAILAQVVEHVGAIDPARYPGVSASEVCSWIDRGGTSQFSGRFWTIDPIDGTKGFLRNEQYAVALALIVDGQVVVGALACPNLPLEAAADAKPGTVFVAVKGQGAVALPLEFGNDPPLDFQPIRVSQQDDPAAVRFCESVESGHSAQGDSAAIAERLGIVASPIRLDSQAKYGVVARGRPSLSPHAHPRRLPREDLGPRRGGPDRRGGRGNRDGHHGQASGVSPRPRAFGQPRGHRLQRPAP